MRGMMHKALGVACRMSRERPEDGAERRPLSLGIGALYGHTPPLTNCPRASFGHPCIKNPSTLSTRSRSLCPGVPLTTTNANDRRSIFDYSTPGKDTLAWHVVHQVQEVLSTHVETRRYDGRKRNSLRFMSMLLANVHFMKLLASAPSADIEKWRYLTRRIWPLASE